MPLNELKTKLIFIQISFSLVCLFLAAPSHLHPSYSLSLLLLRLSPSRMSTTDDTGRTPSVNSRRTTAAEQSTEAEKSPAADKTVAEQWSTVGEHSTTAEERPSTPNPPPRFGKAIDARIQGACKLLGAQRGRRACWCDIT